MRFQICLVDHIKAQFIAQVIELRRIGIVRRAHGVQVQALHQLKVAAHGLVGAIKPDFWIMIVAVHALQLDPAAVEPQAAILDLDLADAYPLIDDLVPAQDLRPVQHRRFRRPALRPIDGKGGAVSRLLAKQFAVRREQAQRAGLFAFYRNMDLGARQVTVRFGRHAVVAHRAALAGQDIHLAEDAGHPPFVLILQICIVTAFQYRDGDLVASFV